VLLPEEEAELLALSAPRTVIAFIALSPPFTVAFTYTDDQDNNTRTSTTLHSIPFAYHPYPLTTFSTHPMSTRPLKTTLYVPPGSETCSRALTCSTRTRATESTPR
jgi:hypothetical protein